MNYLRRTKVDNFKIEDSVKLDEIILKKDNIISIEKYFSNNSEIELNDRKLELFLNGVNLTFELNNGIYRIYNAKKEFIGIGIVENKLLKRDVIL